MDKIRIIKSPTKLSGEVFLPGSKSISNRVLLINALSGSQIPVEHVSEAEDTQDMIRCLNDDGYDIYVGEGAAVLRFVLAYFFVSKKTRHVTASESLTRRPIKPLIDVLQQFGASFNFDQELNSLPCVITTPTILKINEIEIEAHQSSQFVSAILLIAPYLEHELKIRLPHKMVSASYIHMTISLMKLFGVEVQCDEHTFQIKPSNYKHISYTVEADWSSAAFIFCIAALADNVDLFIKGLKKSGLQADEKIVDYINEWGVRCQWMESGCHLSRPQLIRPKNITIDFLDHPDLFPALMILCAKAQINVTFTNVQHLQFKESNRLKILCEFICSYGSSVYYETTEEQLDIRVNNIAFKFIELDNLDTHNDHRLAMAYSLLGVNGDVQINNPMVVKKSFPEFWNVLKTIGFELMING